MVRSVLSDWGVSLSVVLFVLFLVSVCLGVSGFVFDVGVLRVAGFSLFALVLAEWAYDDVEGG